MDLREFLVRNKMMVDDWANRWVADVADEQAFAHPLPAVNPIFWLVGHITTADDWLLQALRGSSRATLPASFVKDFGTGVTVRMDAHTYPGWTELREFRRRVLAQLHSALETVTDEELDTPTEIPPPAVASSLNIKRRALAGMTAHTVYHIGQISLLRKALGLPRSL